MPIKRKDRRSAESNISRVMQQRIPFPVEAVAQEARENLINNPETDPEAFDSLFEVEDDTVGDAEVAAIDPDGTGFFFKTNPIITQDDALDQDQNLNLETVFTSTANMSMEQNTTSGTWNMISETTNFKITEPVATSEKGEYNKIYVLIDREDHTFFFDWTPGNLRTLLKHPSGGYFAWDNSGNYTFKTKKPIDEVLSVNAGEDVPITDGGNAFFFIDGNRNESILGDDIRFTTGSRHEHIQGSSNFNIEDNLNTIVAGTMSTRINANSFWEISKNQIFVIGGFVTENVAGYKEQNIKGPYTITSLDQILFDAPTIEFRTTNLIMNNRGSIIESIGGLREISAGALGLQTINNMSLTAGQNISITAVGKSEEIISGASAIPSVTTKLIRTILGNIKIEALVGNVGISALGSIDVQNILAGLSIDPIGQIDLAGPIGSLNINVAGIAELDGTLVNLGTGAAEPVLKGLTSTMWLATHNHPTGVGPSGPPFQAGLLQTLLSMKVFTV